jgi:hypothetical protein
MARAIVPREGFCEACGKYAYISPISAELDNNVTVIFELCEVCVAELSLIVARRDLRERAEVN